MVPLECGGSPPIIELVPADLIRAAHLDLIRYEEFRKNDVKFAGSFGKPNPRLSQVRMLRLLVVTDLEVKTQHGFKQQIPSGSRRRKRRTRRIRHSCRGNS